MEDLTTEAVASHEQDQLASLAAFGLHHDGDVVRQSERATRYDLAIDALSAAGLTYPCFCSRREIRDAAAAPHGTAPEGAYAGTCASLSVGEVESRRAEGRREAVRLRAGGIRVEVRDRSRGLTVGVVDDLVLRRGDGVAAYNLAVVVDDAEQGVTQVVRGDDLLGTTPRQVLLQRLLGLPTPEYVHVPLVLGPDGSRLAKRHGAVTLSERLAAGDRAPRVLGMLAASLGWAAPGEELTAAEVLARFDPDRIPSEPWVFPG
jgi:glutamyl-tRNA synthetase